MADKNTDKPQITRVDAMKSMCTKRVILKYLLGLVVSFFFFKISVGIGLIFIICLLYNFHLSVKDEKEYLDQKARKDAFVARMKAAKEAKKQYEAEQSVVDEDIKPSIETIDEIVKKPIIFFDKEDAISPEDSEDELSEEMDNAEEFLPIEEMPEPTREPYDDELIADYDALRYYITHTICNVKNEGDLFVGIMTSSPKTEYKRHLQNQMESWAANHSNLERKKSKSSKKHGQPVQKSLFEDEESKQRKPIKPVVNKQYIPQLSSTWVNGYYNEEGVYIAGHFED